MANQYFEKNPTVQHELKSFEFELRGHRLKFTSDQGVFSKRTVDYGSRVLIDNFSFADLPSGPILDLGCGYGPIGLGLAADQPQRFYTLVDLNQRALALAQQNVIDNQIDNVEIFTSDAYENVNQKYAAILTNPPVRAGKDVVASFITNALQYLVNNGELWLVLQKKQGAPSAKKLMQATFGNCTTVQKDKGYYILKSKKRAQ